jgi:hypothetical protein
MKSLLREMDEKFQIHEATCDCGQPDCAICNPEDLEEQNVTGAIAGYNTPAAFAKPNKWKSKNIKYEAVQDVLDKKYLELIEGYRDYKKGDVKPSHKVKDSIREIAKKLHEIETIIGHTTRLKTESGVAATEYGPAASKALTKISERLIKISERVRSLGE